MTNPARIEQLGPVRPVARSFSLVAQPLFCSFDVVRLAFEFTRHRQQDRSRVFVAGAPGQIATMIGVVPQLEGFIFHLARTRQYKRSSGFQTIIRACCSGDTMIYSKKSPAILIAPECITSG